MTKKLSLLFTLMLSTLMASAYDAEVDGMYYNLIAAKQAEVTSGDTEYTGSVTIPESFTYNGVTYRVTSIGNWAFENCSGLTSITIPNSVTSIGTDAFYGTAWYNNQPEGLVYAGLVAYKYKGTMPANTSIRIKEGTLSIGDYAFQSCSGLTSVTIPNSVTSIGDYAFSYCYGLTSVTIGNSVTSIGDYAFNNCSGLTSVTIPNSVTSIGNSAFYGCYIEKKDFINNSSLDAAANSYWGATIVDSRNNGFVIKDGTLLKYTGNDVSVTIPNSVTSIGNDAFNNCSGLTSVTIPNSVTSIGNDAFSYCSGLTSVTIPNSVTSIGERAFIFCSGLTSVTIGSGVTSIGSGAFEGADIPTVISLIENPFAINGKTYDFYRTFSQNTFMNATLYVPKGTIEKYKAADGWKDFFFIKEGDPFAILRGDVNGDGEVNVGDLVSVSNYMAGDGSVSKEAADVNEDGEVNVGDMVVISNIMSGNE